MSIDYSDKTRFARGVAIIFARNPDAEVCANHDVVRVEDSPAEEQQTLASLGSPSARIKRPDVPDTVLVACIWCAGTSYIPETGVMCRICRGSGFVRRISR